MRCPGAVTPPRRSVRGSVRFRPAPSPKGANPAPAIGFACDASVRRPLAARLPSASDGAASAGHLPLLQRHRKGGTLSPAREEKWGSRSGSLEGGRRGRSEGLQFRFPRRHAPGRTCGGGPHVLTAAYVSHPMPSWSPSNPLGSGGSTLKSRYGICEQSRSGGGGGMHTVGYAGSQFPPPPPPEPPPPPGWYRGGTGGTENIRVPVSR